MQEIPTAASRVTLADGVVDDLGRPVARLEGAQHAETLRTAEVDPRRGPRSGCTRAARAGCGRTPIGNGLTAGQHQAGTCRMGDDPATSVTDPWGRVHGHDNLWVHGRRRCTSRTVR